MTEKPLEPVLEEILACLKQFPDGASISEIAENMTSQQRSDRTLLRRLTFLVALGKVEAIGTKCARRYRLLNTSSEIPLSPLAQSQKDQVSQPIIKRKPVGYNENFLFDYTPNESFYLSLTERKHLKEVGAQFGSVLEPGTYVKSILNKFLIDLAWNSSRLEGNTYSLLETERLIEFGAEAEGKNVVEAQMIVNHRAAIEFMVALGEDLNFNKTVVFNTHALLSNNLLANPRARGQLRQIPVGIGRTAYHPITIPQLIEQCFERIIQTASVIKDPFEQAFFVLVHLPYLQPFEEVNKRVSHLSCNIPFIRNNLSPLSFNDVPKEEYIRAVLAVYELNHTALLRDVFIWAYERSAQKYQFVQNTIGPVDTFHMRYQKQLAAVIKHIIEQNVQGSQIIQAITELTKQNIPNEDHNRFARLVEKELADVHEGNCSIFHVSSAAFKHWKANQPT